MEHVSQKERVQPDVLDVELSGKNGIRVRWAGYQKCSVERLVDGVWTKIPLVQDIFIKLSCTDPLPSVTLRSLVIPASEGEQCESSSPVPEASATLPSSSKQ